MTATDFLDRIFSAPDRDAAVAAAQAWLLNIKAGVLVSIVIEGTGDQWVAVLTYWMKPGVAEDA